MSFQALRDKDLELYQGWRMTGRLVRNEAQTGYAFLIVSPDSNYCALVHNGRVIGRFRTSTSFRKDPTAPCCCEIHLMPLTSEDFEERYRAAGESAEWAPESEECDEAYDEDDEFGTHDYSGVDPRCAAIYLSADGARVFFEIPSTDGSELFDGEKCVDLPGRVRELFVAPTGRSAVIATNNDCYADHRFLVNARWVTGFLRHGQFSPDGRHFVGIHVDRSEENCLFTLDGDVVLRTPEFCAWNCTAPILFDDTAENTVLIDGKSRYAVFCFLPEGDGAAEPVTAVLSLSDGKLTTFPGIQILDAQFDSRRDAFDLLVICSDDRLQPKTMIIGFDELR